MIKILAGSASRYLGESIAREFGMGLGNVIIQRFSDGEFQPSIEETVRGKKFQRRRANSVLRRARRGRIGNDGRGFRGQ